jgi:hypothetical protein
MEIKFQNIEDLFGIPFKYPDLKGKNVLILGLGGGCDIFSAYVVKKHIEDMGTKKIIYGNSHTKVHDDMKKLSPLIGRVGDTIIDLGDNPFFSHINLEKSTPRGDDGCPFIFCLPSEAHVPQLAHEIQKLGFDYILAVDTGCDSIASSEYSGKFGLDAFMMKVIEQTKIPTTLIILGPGCDGESDAKTIEEALIKTAIDEQYLGCFYLDTFEPIFEDLTAALPFYRTPVIISHAVQKYRRNGDHLEAVPRGIEPKIPLKWLTHGFAFQLKSKIEE